MKIIGLDVGKTRVGIAMADLSEKSCQALETYPRARKQAETKILEFIEKNQIDLLVVGLPLDENGQETSECESIRRFCQRLCKRALIKVEFVDEWGSSLDAKQRLNLSASIDPRIRKSGVIDAEAASIILERYLSNQGN